MPENADTVVITDSLKPDVLALLRLIYKAPPSTAQVVDSHAAVVTALRKFQSIRRLILMLEGNTGQLMVRRVLRSLKKYADDLAGTTLRIGEEIVFDGCNIALGCVEIAAIMKVLHAPRATGFTTTTWSNTWTWLSPRAEPMPSLSRETRDTGSHNHSYFQANQPRQRWRTAPGRIRSTTNTSPGE